MKYLVSLITCLLVGCSTPVPVVQKFPEVPKELMQSCPDLTTIDSENIELSEFLKVVTDNYTNYHNCELMNNLWMEWYKSQKQIFENIK